LQKLSQAKARLLVEHPYFGTLASRLELLPSDAVGTFVCDGIRFEGNDAYLETLDMDELGFALANGAMHAALAHESRRNGRMGWLWQLATDYAINAMLVENGLSAPEGIHYDPRFEGMYAEEIYATLKDEIKNQEFDGDASNDTGFNEQNRRHNAQMQNAEGNHDTDAQRPSMEVENEMRPVADQTEEEAFERLGREVLEKMRQREALPEGIERFFCVEAPARIDWRQELHLLLDRYYRNDYRMMPPSKKLLYAGTYLPSLDADFFSAVIAIDSSGSVDEVLLGSFMNEIESLMLSFAHYRIDVLVCDTKVRSHDTFVGGQRLEVALAGGGGTDFRPVFEYVEAHLADTQQLLYFTDLKGRFPDGEPLYETVWIAPDEGKVPFGRVIVLDGA